MASLLKKAYWRIQQDGVGVFVRSSISFFYSAFLRRFLPKKQRVANYNGIESPVEVGILDPYVPNYESPWYTQDIPGYEKEEVDGLRRHTSEGDDVLVIGGGYGVTTVVAAEEVGKSGSVLTYEASRDCFEKVGRTVEHNEMEDHVEVHHAIVGEATDLRGEAGDAEIVAPTELPEADILEMDCEGAELIILEQMSIKPRTILVETHAQYGAPKDRVIEILREADYRIIKTINKDWDGIYHLTARIDSDS